MSTLDEFDFDPDLSELNEITASMEAAKLKLERSIELYEEFTQVTEKYDAYGNISNESFSDLTHAMSSLLYTSGLDVPKDIIVSMEAAEEEVKDTKVIKTTADEAKDNAVKERTKTEALKETVDKFLKWIAAQWKVFMEWLKKRAEKLGLISAKVLADNTRIETALQEIK